MFILVDACVFVMWFGAWSACHGWGALGTAALWTVGMWVCLCCEAFGNGATLWRSGCGKIPALASFLGLAVWILYFFGLGDWIRLVLPKSFPEGGAVRSLSQCGVLQYAVLVVWCMVRIRNLAFILRHRKLVSLAAGLGAFFRRFRSE